MEGDEDGSSRKRKKHRKKKEKDKKHGSDKKKKKEKKRHKTEKDETVERKPNEGSMNGSSHEPEKFQKDLSLDDDSFQFSKEPAAKSNVDNSTRETDEFEEVDDFEAETDGSDSDNAIDDDKLLSTNLAGKRGSYLPKKAQKRDSEAFSLSAGFCGSDPSKEPIVVNFANVPPPENDVRSLPTFEVRQQGPGKSRRRHIYGTDEKCTYVASSSGDGTTKMLVGIYDKQQNKLNVYQASDRGTVFGLQQHITTKMSQESEQSAARRRLGTYEATSASLYSDFGSVKKKKVIKAQAANRISMESVVGSRETVVNSIKAGVKQENSGKEDSEEEKLDPAAHAINEARKALLPEFDIHASEPHLVYSARKIAGEAAWGQISRHVDSCLHKSDWLAALTGQRTNMKAEQQWPQSLSELLNSMDYDTIKNNHDEKNRLKSLLLLQHMLRFHKFFSSSFRMGSSIDIAKLMGISREVAGRLLELFAEPTTHNGRAGFSSNKQHKQKRHIYMLLLFMICQGNEMVVSNLNDFLLDIGTMDSAVASRLLTEAGCTAKKNIRGVLSVTLKVPLTFPQPRSKKRT